MFLRRTRKPNQSLRELICVCCVYKIETCNQMFPDVCCVFIFFFSFLCYQVLKNTADFKLNLGAGACWCFGLQALGMFNVF